MAFRWLHRLFRLKGFDDLVEEERYPMFQLCLGCFGCEPLSDFQPASLYQFTPILRKELEHPNAIAVIRYLAQGKGAARPLVTDAPTGAKPVTKEDFANFELKVEFRTTDNVNSGVMLRNPRPKPSKKGGAGEGYEVQIRDKNPGHYTGGAFLTGSLVNVEKAPADVKIVSGEWIPLDITADGDHFVILYNGRKVVDAHDTKLENGAIGLQWAHPEDAVGTKIEFRNIKVRRLK